jgi:hypothetical protein
MFHLLIRRLAIVAATLLLAACAGTIHRENPASVASIAGATYTGVEVVLSDGARRLQAENPQFSVRELGDFVRRRLESTDLLNARGTHRVEITIDNFRVRNAVAAIMLGIMAGTDSIDGYVRIYDARGRQVHGFKVNASYGLGGWAGGQDGMRMNWLYDKFSELAVAELGGKTEAASVRGTSSGGTASKSSGVSITPANAGQPVRIPAQPPQAVAIAPPAPRAPIAAPSAPAPVAAAARFGSGFAAIDDVDAVPYLSDRGRNGYREYLTRPTPKAFAIAPNGHWFSAWSLAPSDAAMPTDPSERAMLICERSAKVPCKLYAVNSAVVWTKDPR